MMENKENQKAIETEKLEKAVGGYGDSLAETGKCKNDGEEFKPPKPGIIHIIEPITNRSDS